MNEAATAGGMRLRAARELRGMSLLKVSAEMRLEPPVIEALEAGDLPRVGPTVYAKGYLRRYALLLGLPVEEVLGAFGLGHSVPLNEGAAADGLSRGAPAVAMLPLLGAASAVMLLASLLWWKPWSHKGLAPAPVVPAEPSQAGHLPGIAPEEPMAEREADATIPVLPGAPSAQAPAPGHADALLATGPASGAAKGRSAAAVGPAAEQPGAGRARLRLSFSSDSWVEVHDAQGNKTFVGNGAANTVRTLSAQAPVHVYLRQGGGVQLEINGHTVAIGPQFFAGDVARFQAGADGVLRREPPREASASNTRPPG